jgi:hypothetical protein
MFYKTKAGRLYDCWAKWKALPERNNLKNNQKAHKFEQGLKRFADRTLTKAVNAFKHEYDECQQLKKRAAIQMIELTQTSQRKMYVHWIKIVEQIREYRKCRSIFRNFESLYKVIKSVADNALANSKEAKMKEDAIWKIYANQHFCLESSFRRWIEVNRREKNRSKRMEEIQRSFLAKLMKSKAGLVMMAWKNWKSLPVRINRERNQKANKFEAGLRRFVDRTLNKAMGSFKNEFDLGQATKKRSVIQLIDVTMGGQKKFYQRWI